MKWPDRYRGRSKNTHAGISGLFLSITVKNVFSETGAQMIPYAEIKLGACSLHALFTIEGPSVLQVIYVSV